jgi:isocitrate dehydrogenase
MTLRTIADRYDVPEIKTLATFTNSTRVLGPKYGVKKHFGFLLHQEGEPQDPRQVNQFNTPPSLLHEASHLYRQDTDSYMFNTAVKYGCDSRLNFRVTDVEFDDRIVDNMSMQLVQRPEEYDVLVCPNLYGDIVSDLGAGMIGGLGLAPGANIGTEGAIFEATHGSAPKYKGQNKVNPTALLLSGVLMLKHLGEDEAAERMENGIAEVIRKGEKVTYDLKPSRDDPSAVGTSEFADAVIEEMS